MKNRGWVSLDRMEDLEAHTALRLRRVREHPMAEVVVARFWVHLDRMWKELQADDNGKSMTYEKTVEFLLDQETAAAKTRPGDSG